jgi:hypothetical protein
MFEWRAKGQKHTDPLLKVRPNAYGPGVGADQYGRPVKPYNPHKRGDVYEDD